jgi:hypothetical protein
MSAEEKSQKQVQRHSVHSLAQSREFAKQALSRSEASGAPPYQSVINPRPPKPGRPGGPKREEPSWAGSLRELHTSMLEFWEEVRIYRDRASELWEEPLIKVEYPIEGDFSREPRDYERDHYVQSIEFKVSPIALSTLGWWRYRDVTLARRHTKDHRRKLKTTRRSEKVYLPPAAAKVCYEKLNDVLQEIGLAAVITATTHKSEEPGL